MKQPRSAYLLPALALAWLLALWPAPRPAAACSPPPVTPWFDETISADASSLPAGVLLRNKTVETLALTNTTSVPLHVIGAEDFGVGHYPPFHLALPAGQGALYRLQDSQVWEWTWPMEQPETGPNVMDWVPASETYRRADALEISPGRDRLGATHSDTLAQYPSGYRTGDNRPADAPPPAPRSVTLTLAYGDAMLTVPVTVAYRLNPRYEPGSVARYDGFKGCYGPESSDLWLALGGALGILALLAVLGRQFLRARRRPEERA